MINGMSVQSDPDRETGGRVVWQVLGILLAAVVLGIIYNQSSPLGVRQPAPDELPLSATVHRTKSDPLSAGSDGAMTNVSSWGFNPTPPGRSNPAVAPTELRFQELKWPAVKALLAAGQIVLVDARLAETYALSRIPGAVSLPAYSPTEQLQAFAAKHPRDTRFVIYCNSEACDMSHELAAKLARQFGYTNLALMPGGFAEYVIAESSAANPSL
jgi:rhodanese-related sulfurtransferase